MHKNILFGSLTLLFLIAMACTRVVCPEPDERPSCQLESSRFYFLTVLTTPKLMRTTRRATLPALRIPGRTAG
ncbi:hypothetical protein MKQ70_09220 [Chitinophaga sedimenti]|uniref:hypothetical protein n=1 Tax=Chitinophaga sedimenti TaxID=2033606 RepID=UPI002006A9F1|nr:hypothetical protein [Chitinophaga sedimenti]MCK7555175.1 hypothetical protein [Chitinophaga sedimenti]